MVWGLAGLRGGRLTGEIDVVDRHEEGEACDTQNDNAVDELVRSSLNFKVVWASDGDGLTFRLAETCLTLQF